MSTTGAWLLLFGFAAISEFSMVVRKRFASSKVAVYCLVVCCCVECVCLEKRATRESV